MTQAYTNRFTEVVSLTGAVFPQTQGAGTYTYGYASAANFQRGAAILLVGTMAGGSTLDVQLWQATDAAGTDAKIIAGKAITQLTAAGGDGNDAVLIELRTEELDVDGGFSFVSAVVTVAGANVTFALLGLGTAANYVPVPTTNWTEVVD